MVRCRDYIHNLILLKHPNNDPIAKMTTLVIVYSLRPSKSAENIQFQECGYLFCIIQFSCLCFFSFRNVVHRNINIAMCSGIWKWTHKVYSPHIKNLTENHFFSSHFIPFHDIFPNHLTSLTCNIVAGYYLFKIKIIEIITNRIY